MNLEGTIGLFINSETMNNMIMFTSYPLQLVDFYSFFFYLELRWLTRPEKNTLLV